MKYETLFQIALTGDPDFKELLDDILYLTSEWLRPMQWTCEQIHDKLRPYYISTQPTIAHVITPLLIGLQLNSANAFIFIRRIEILRTAIKLIDRNKPSIKTCIDGWIFVPNIGIDKFDAMLGRDINVFMTRMYSFKTSAVFASGSVFMDWVRYIDEGLY